MGIESFYVKLSIQNFKKDYINYIFEHYKTFQTAFTYYWLEDSNILCVRASLVNFFPACELLYKLFDMISYTSTITQIEAVRQIHKYDFKEFTEFFSWIYHCWYFKLEYFNREWGAFLIKPSKYYDERRKLRKKYMFKY